MRICHSQESKYWGWPCKQEIPTLTTPENHAMICARCLNMQKEGAVTVHPKTVKMFEPGKILQEQAERGPRQ